MIEEAKVNTKTLCQHCGDICPDDSIVKEGMYFCCSGCLFVYELLRDNSLDNYYKLSEKSGLKPVQVDSSEYSYLDDDEIKDKLLQFSINGISKLTLLIPEIYCSACIWLLENLNRLNKGILESSVNFLKREITITYKENETSLREVVTLLVSLGYK
ncbi:MAG: P-type Cu+ transporter, partial [Bacteroidota bacterium]|nr:P-type Cu+ transporter [Bacteroidota bacterium]